MDGGSIPCRIGGGGDSRESMLHYQVIMSRYHFQSSIPLLAPCRTLLPNCHVLGCASLPLALAVHAAPHACSTHTHIMNRVKCQSTAMNDGTHTRIPSFALYRPYYCQHLRRAYMLAASMSSSPCFWAGAACAGAASSSSSASPRGLSGMPFSARACWIAEYTCPHSHTTPVLQSEGIWGLRI